MAWRNPRFAFYHAAQEAGVSAITPTPAAHADFPLDFLIDNRAGSNFKFASSAAADIEIDRTGAPSPAIDRLIIPAGHVLGATITLEAADDALFTVSQVTLLNAVAVTSGVMVDESFTSNTQRYVRLTIAGVGQWEIPELYLTQTRAPSVGPEQGWRDELRHNTLRFDKASGAVAALSLGPDRRAISYTYRGVDVAADLAIFAELLAAVGTSRPFYLDPAFDTEPALYVTLERDSRQQQDPAVPATTNATQRRIALELLEHLG